MSRPRRDLLAVVLLAGELVACSAPPAAREVDIALARATKEVRCNHLDEFDLEPTAFRALDAEIAQFARSYASVYGPPGVPENAALAAQCLDAIAEADCAGLVWWGSTAFDVCAVAASRQREVGASCGYALECAPSAWCDADAEGCGVCVARVADGGPCEWRDGSCMLGAVCRSGRCARLVTLGASCDPLDVPCVGSICDPAVGRCVAPPPDAWRGCVACEEDQRCLNGLCLNVTPVDVGESCAIDAPERGGRYCVDQSTRTVCTPHAALGACVERTPLGGDCARVPCNPLEASCSPDQVCVPLGTVRAPCDSTLRCQAGLECHGSRCDVPVQPDGACLR